MQDEKQPTGFKINKQIPKHTTQVEQLHETIRQYR